MKMKSGVRVLVLAVALAGSALGRPSRSAAPAPRLQVLVPAYFYPGGPGQKAWDELIAAGAQAPITAIANPASGPGRAVDPNYTAVIRRARQAGITVIGYVSTSYAKRPRPEVEADISKWLELYPNIQGFFFDEQASGKEEVPYYSALRGYAQGKLLKAQVFTNPGTECVKEYFEAPAADVTCVWENKEGFMRFRRPAAAASVGPERLSVLAYQVDGAEGMVRHLNHAAALRVGYAYITDDAGANPWDRLPSYWKRELEEVWRLNR